MPDDPLWYGSEGPRDATIAIVAESWGSEEFRLKRPLVGSSGSLSDSMLADCGLRRADIFLTNMCSRHPADNKVERFFFTNAEAKQLRLEAWKGCYPRPETMADINRMRLQISKVQPKVIITYGNWAVWALTSGYIRTKSETVKVPRGKFMQPLGSFKVPKGILAWRGSQLDSDILDASGKPIPLIPCIHPAAIQRQQYLIYPTKHDIRKRAIPIANGIIQEPNYDFTIRPTFDQVLRWIMDSIRSRSIRWSIDLETRGGHIACICLATSATRAISIPFMCVERPTGYFEVGQELIIRKMLLSILNNPEYEIVGQNFAYDMQYLARYLFAKPQVHHDTMIMQRLLWPGTPLGLSYLASMYCRYYRYWKDEGKEWEPGIPEEQLWHYNCIDGVTAWEISYVQEELIQHYKLEAQAAEQMEISRMGFEMMDMGVLVDKKARQQMTMDVWEERERNESWLRQCMPVHIPPLLRGKTAKSEWFSSPTQQAKLFYEILAIPPVIKRGTGVWTCDDAALEIIKQREPIVRPLVEKIQHDRTLGIFHSNFLTKALDPDGRMRCSFNPLPNTFRWSSSENAFGRGTNLQTIPKGDDE